MKELEYDDHTFLLFEVKETDDSFDTPFGTKKEVSVSIEDLAVVTYIGNMDYDVTKALTEKQFAYFKEWALEKWLEMR